MRTIDEGIARLKELHAVIHEQFEAVKRAPTRTERIAANARLADLRGRFWTLESAIVTRWQETVGLPTVGAYARQGSPAAYPELFLDVS